MKKIIFIIMFMFIGVLTIKADGNLPPVQINLLENFYSDVTKSYKDGVFTFNYKNNLLTMDLTNTELKSILQQNSGSGSSRLTYYETLNIIVTPVEGTPYESLEGKTMFYRANDGGSWISNPNDYETEADDVASKFNLNNNFWPWGFKIQYRLDESGTFTSAIPSGKDLSNKTLEEQLATIFDIDLDEDPDGVTDLYPNKIKFNPLPSGYNFAIRFDFLDEKDSAPVLEEDSTTEYLTSSLKHLGDEYVIIKYDRSEDAPTNIIIDEKTSNSSFNKVLLVPITLGVLSVVAASIYYLKYKIRIVK